MGAMHCQARTANIKLVKAHLKLYYCIISLNNGAEVSVSLSTFDLQAFQRVDIWVLVDQITNFQHTLCSVDVHHVSEV